MHRGGISGDNHERLMGLWVTKGRVDTVPVINKTGVVVLMLFGCEYPHAEVNEWCGLINNRPVAVILYRVFLLQERNNPCVVSVAQ